MDTGSSLPTLTIRDPHAPRAAGIRGHNASFPCATPLLPLVRALAGLAAREAFRANLPVEATAHLPTPGSDADAAL
jgi:hypothetical protein